MNILLLAPHPFYQERGTPIAVDLLLHGLGVLGRTVALEELDDLHDLVVGDERALGAHQA